MIEIIDSKEIKDLNELEEAYYGKKILIIIDEESFKVDKINIKGKLYAVSDSVESYDELADTKWKLMDTGKLAMLAGSYGGGGMDIGVQFEI